MKLNEKTQMWESAYWHPAVTVDAVVFGYDEAEGELSVLLIERGEEPFKGKWALPGGFVTQEDESVEAAVERELREETNVTDIYLKEFKTFSKIGRDPRPNERVISVAFLALVDKNNFEVKGGDDARNAQWFLLKDLPELAFDHKDMINGAFDNLQMTIHYEPLAFHLLNKDAFTMPQLHNIYRTIINPSVVSSNIVNDRRNFAKKMLSLGYIKETNKVLTGCSNRPPKLYRFDEDEFKMVKDNEMRQTI